MNQSIFALAALVAAMVFSFAQQQTVVESELRRVDQLYTSRSAREAVQLLDRLEHADFDPAGKVTSTDELTLSTNLTAESGISDVNILNDAGALEDEPIVKPDSIGLYLSADVGFVEPASDGSFEDSTDPTFYKKVTVTVRPSRTDTSGGITLSRVYTYTPELSYSTKF